jgi:cellulose synthase/poly-beta-1,6-N-acetylglucosamine synthase-like glycosyltransferase
MNDIVKLILLIILLLTIVFFAPFITIWSMNTLFALTIPYTFWTWVAMSWLSLVTFGGVIHASKKRD